MERWKEAVNAGLIEQTDYAFIDDYPDHVILTVKQLTYGAMADNRFVLPPVCAPYVGSSVSQLRSASLPRAMFMKSQRLS